MRRYLIIANQTLGGKELVDAVRERVAAGPCEFWVVVPATPVTHLETEYLAMPVMGGVPGVQGSPEEATSAARAQLDAACRQLRGVGATVDGEVGDPDPIRAAEAAMKGREFDEIVVSTLPTRLSRWLRQDLPHRLERRFRQPVVQVTPTEAVAATPATPATPASPAAPATPATPASPAAPASPSAPASPAAPPDEPWRAGQA